MTNSTIQPINQFDFKGVALTTTSSVLGGVNLNARKKYQIILNFEDQAKAQKCLGLLLDSGALRSREYRIESIPACL